VHSFQPFGSGLFAGARIASDPPIKKADDMEGNLHIHRTLRGCERQAVLTYRQSTKHCSDCQRLGMFRFLTYANSSNSVKVTLIDGQSDQISVCNPHTPYATFYVEIKEMHDVTQQ